MVKKRVYKKFFSRPISLLKIDFLFRGENYGIKKLSGGRFYFNPLIVYKKGGWAEDYYDISNPKNDPKPMIQYFIKHPQKFKEQAKKYLGKSAQIIKYIDSCGSKDLKKLRQLVLSFQPMLTLAVVLGRQYKNGKNNPTITLAYNLREKTDRIIYRATEKILAIFKKIRPQLKSSINFLTFDELYKKAPSDREIKKRKNGFIYFEGSVYAGVSLADFQKLKKIEISEEEDIVSEEIKEIKGATAMGGRVRGGVKVVIDIKQLKKVKDGDILVAPMTTPHFLSVIKKSAAIVTDEGGVTCHAAIVARELDIPCVIGTKIATKVLKDGDMVEVDATRGIVKKI